MSGSLAELIARRRKENPPDLVTKKLEIPMEVASLPPPPSYAPQPEHLRMEDVPHISPEDPVAYKVHWSLSNADKAFASGMILCWLSLTLMNN